MLTTQQIGRCGELLVQYKLLLQGIESAPMTTDAGIDLVAFSSKHNKAITIQVKTNEQPKPGGGKGKAALDWWIAEQCSAEHVAFVDLSTCNVWLFTMEEIALYAQQHPHGRYHFYMYVDTTVNIKTGKMGLFTEFENFLIERRAPSLFL